MKRLILAILIMLISGLVLLVYEPVSEIKLIINEEIIELDEPVKMEEDKLFVPAKLVFEKLGADTIWDTRNKILSGMLGGFQVDLDVDGNEIAANGKTVAGDVPVIIIEEVIYAPVRPTAKAWGALVDWNEETRTLKIYTPSEFDPAPEDDQQGPLLHVAYPSESQSTYYGNRLFVFGTTQSYSQVEVTVNGEPVEALDPRSGNFLTMVNIPFGEEFLLKVKATDAEGSTTVERSVVYPEGLQPMPEKPLEIHSTHLIPDQDQVLSPGDTLRIVARGSPGATAHYRIGEGVFIEMTELEYPTGPPGRGGIYTATYEVDQRDAPSAGVSDLMPVTVTLVKDGERVSLKLPGKLAFFSTTPYKVVEVRKQHELKYRGWLRIIQDDYYQLYSATRSGSGYPANIVSYLTEGTRFEVVGVSGDYYRVKLKENDTHLVHKEAVRELEGKDSLKSSLSALGLLSIRDKVSLRLNATERFPFHIESGTNQLEIRLYGLKKAEELTLPEIIEPVNELTLETSAEEPNLLVLTVELDKNFTGFDSTWVGTDLVLDLYKPPRISKDDPLGNKTIVIDPGHGGKDPGAPGPGDLHEKDAVLEISLYLRDLLTGAGADVIMTRTEDKTVNLYERPEAMAEHDADLFISIHANAHAQDTEAVDLHGIMTLYSYDHNYELAKIMLDKVSEEMGLPAMTTWKRNLAVLRHSQLPGVLVEAGYMMHPEDNWYILHPAGQEKFAAAIKEGIKEYFHSITTHNNR